MAATEKTKEILESIDRLVAEEQNKERLAEIQVSQEVLWIKQGFGSVFICYGSGSRLNTDPDPGFLLPKIRKNSQLKKKVIFFWSIYLSLGLHKGRPSYKRRLQLSKEKIQRFKTWNFVIFSTFVGHFCSTDLLNPDPLTWLNLDPDSKPWNKVTEYASTFDRSQLSIGREQGKGYSYRKPQFLSVYASVCVCHAVYCLVVWEIAVPPLWLRLISVNFAPVLG